MRNPGALLCFLVLVGVGGGGATLPAAPSTCLSPEGSTQAPTIVPLVISVGDQVTGILGADELDLLFELTAPFDGALVVQLSWDPSLRNLQLYLEDEVFFALPPEWSWTTGALQVVAGRTYRVWISDPARWDYGQLAVPFVLTTSMQSEMPAIPTNECTTSQPAPHWPCVDGAWVPPDHPLAPGAESPTPPPPAPLSGGAASCATTIQPASDWLCVGDGWVPPNHPLAIVNPPSSPQPPAAPASPVVGSVDCPSGQPAATWICVAGGWVPPGHPLALSSLRNPTPPSPPATLPSGCTTPDPFLGIQGLFGVCVGGNMWVPSGHPLAVGLPLPGGGG